MKDMSTGRSTYHTSLSMNLKEAIEGNYRINPEKVILSKGYLTLSNSVSLKKTDEGIILEWPNGDEMEMSNKKWVGRLIDE